MYRYEKAQFFEASVEDVRGLFSDVANLNSLTPDFFRLDLLDGQTEVPLYEGQLFRYRFRMFGVPVSWTTEIETVAENHFVDIQKGGPYRSFAHSHYFYEVDGATLMLDRIDYSLSFGPLNWLVNLLIVRPILEAVFNCRASKAPQMLDQSGLQDA